MFEKTKTVKIIFIFLLIIVILPYIISCKKKGEDEVEEFKDEEYTVSDTIKILCLDSYVSAIEQFKNLIYDEYGMETEFINYPREFGVDKIAMKLLAGDDDFDIYVAEDRFIPVLRKK